MLEEDTRKIIISFAKDGAKRQAKLSRGAEF